MLTICTAYTIFSKLLKQSNAAPRLKSSHTD